MLTLITLIYSATADRPACVSFLALSSATQQCTPRRPLYTQSLCLKPKSSTRFYLRLFNTNKIFNI